MAARSDPAPGSEYPDSRKPHHLELVANILPFAARCQTQAASARSRCRQYVPFGQDRRRGRTPHERSPVAQSMLPSTPGLGPANAGPTTLRQAALPGFSLIDKSMFITRTSAVANVRKFISQVIVEPVCDFLSNCSSAAVKVSFMPHPHQVADRQWPRASQTVCLSSSQWRVLA